ncbi:MAG: bifunctional phosphopantothenoylcysteine decarboxylase/phosphopantothenate--cysteine ligase CoaBC [Candidatus Marinimicrobia bacterium]|nr:bifunctional phosphopantothenoylcysteine decarboxylase/phosphopantothenate--cysteine ligase CoaBC [Candidatus Neomarinimicrobiota bacterium]
MKNKNILIVVTGSIAAYKACEVVRLLRKEGANVQVMMSKSAMEFVGKTTFAALTDNEVITEIFPKTPKAGLEHIEMAIELDAIVVIPATANTICKVANGVADDVVSTTLSVCEQPTLFAPAMNFRMWQNPATLEAVEKLRKKGSIVLDPEEGQLASLHEGEGRLPELIDILNGIRSLFEIPLPLQGKKVLVTAGPTREAIDPVRFISNRSSGKMGYSLAEKAKDFGAEVSLISGPVSLSPIPEVHMLVVETAEEMAVAVKNNCSDADYLFMVAAVSDYSPADPPDKKIKRDSENKSIELKPALDILKSIKGKTKGKIIAFALETHDGEVEAQRKLVEKGADFIILNYANEKGAGFESSTNRVTIFSKSGNQIELKKDRKDRIAKKIIEYILNN